MKNLKDVAKTLKRIDEHLLRNTIALEHHIKRTDLSEKRIESMELWLRGSLTAIVIGLIVNFFKK
jgi:hypothetical protein